MKRVFLIFIMIFATRTAFCYDDCRGDYHYYCNGRKVETIYCDDYSGDPSVKDECGDYFYDEDGDKCTYTGWNCRSTGYSNSDKYCDASYTCERPPTYTLTRRCGSVTVNGTTKNATGTIANKTDITYNSTYNLRDQDSKCSLTGYELSGWSCTNGLSGLTTSTKWTIKNSSTCTAQWTAKKYDLKYTCGTGTGNDETSNMTYDTTNYSLKTGSGNCSKTGNSFDGWTCKNSSGNSVTLSTSTTKWNIASNVTCTAQWREIPKINLEFYEDENATTLVTTGQCIVDGTIGTLPQAPKRPGYRFTGWKLVSNICDSNSLENLGNIIDESPSFNHIVYTDNDGSTYDYFGGGYQTFTQLGIGGWEIYSQSDNLLITGESLLCSSCNPNTDILPEEEAGMSEKEQINAMREETEGTCYCRLAGWTNEVGSRIICNIKPAGWVPVYGIDASDTATCSYNCAIMGGADGDKLRILYEGITDTSQEIYY